MSKYLCINFNRYVTDESKEEMVTGESFDEALMNYFADEWNEDEFQEWVKEEYKQISETFGCIPGEENDYLFYKID